LNKNVLGYILASFSQTHLVILTATLAQNRGDAERKKGHDDDNGADVPHESKDRDEKR
jgi:hypothetical protein